MIGKISGRLDWRGSDSVLIDVRGVGYIVHVSDRTLRGMPSVGEAVSLFTELLVREDLLQLFGFPTMYEKEWHKLLTTVQGVGAKASMSILGTLGAEGVARAISLGDARAVQSAPGVGPKLAQRVILELKSKAHTVMAMGGGMMSVAEAGDEVIETVAPAPKRAAKAVDGKAEARARASSDALSALANLGYGPADAAEAVAQASGDAPEADTATLIKLALKLLMPKG